MGKILELNGLIHLHFSSETEMARVLNWPRQRLNKITNGDKEPDLGEVRDIANVLEEPFDKVAHIFLSRKSPNGDTLKEQVI